MVLCFARLTRQNAILSFHSSRERRISVRISRHTDPTGGVTRTSDRGGDYDLMSPSQPNGSPAAGETSPWKEEEP
jgi:hypothetical protein